MLSKSPFQRWGLVCFYRNTVFLTIYNGLLYALHTPKIWKRSGEKYKSYGILSKTTHFLSVFCEECVVQQCTEPHAGVVQYGSMYVATIQHLNFRGQETKTGKNFQFKLINTPVPWNMFKVTESGMDRFCSVSGTTMQSLTLITFIV